MIAISVDTVRDMLNGLAKLTKKQEELAAAKAAAKASVTPPVPDEVVEKLRAIDEEFAAKEDVIQRNIDALRGSVTEGTLQLAQSIKGDELQAVYMSGRITWDTKFLEGLMIGYPEIARARKHGEPTVQIRKN